MVCKTGVQESSFSIVDFSFRHFLSFVSCPFVLFCGSLSSLRQRDQKNYQMKNEKWKMEDEKDLH